ncbi:DEAD/DEAH box helicase [Novisyntrophococcus fermenticellae]|uniref:DEAD/DEAH box helicase n=1 Tax=Novisyntrophococcus fermenticellae TaxID=2068655 RepID=UPI001E46B3F6|nr:SNF2-related protein [Novisyntrophococcus fermenticellae]
MGKKLINFHDTLFYKGAGASYGKLLINLGMNIIYPDEDGEMSLELSAGLDKRYRITDLRGFLHNFEQGKPWCFSKNFIFEPDRMYFSMEDRRLLEFLHDIKRTEENHEEVSCFFGGRVCIGEPYRIRFLDLLWQARNVLHAVIGGKRLYIKQDINPELSVAQEKEGSILTVNYSADDDFEPMVSDYSYLFFSKTNCLVYLSQNRRELFRQLYPYKNESCRIRFQIDADDLKLFRKNFLEVYGKDINISLDHETRKKLENIRLVSRVYFDTTVGGIISKVEFCYGKKIFNPLNPQENDKRLREYDSERTVTSQMNALGFRTMGKLYFLDEVDKIVHLLTDNLTSLKKIAEIYYSQDFKKLYVKSPEMAGISLSEDGSVIHMNINLENVSDEELVELLNAIKAGKKYFRLRNGSIVNLNAADSGRFIDLINGLGIDSDSIHDGIFEVPSNRCLYLENYRKEKGLSDVTVDARFGGLIRTLSGACRDKDEKLFPGHLEGVLREYQIQGVRWMKKLASYSFGGILADEMGLGKTLQVLAFLAGEGKKGIPSLVVAPTSLLYNWKQEAARFLPELKVLLIEGSGERRRQLLSSCLHYDLLVTSYTTLKNDIETYEGMEFSYVFVDEAQNIKNPETLNAGSVKKLDAGCCFAITGTPIENRLQELWSIFDFLMPGYLFSREKFRKVYEEPIMQGKDEGRHTELSEAVRPFILRRMKKEVLTELPALTQTNCLTGMTESQKKLYAACYKDFKRELKIKIDQYGIERSHIEILAALTRLRQICAHPATFLDNYKGGSGKLDFAMDIIEESVSNGHSVLVFSQFTRLLKIIEAELIRNHVNYYYLDGTMKAEDRAIEIDNFNSDKEAVFLISLKAGGTGINLTKADIVIQFDPWWNPAVESQASARAHRMGQKNPVQVYHLLTQGTIEEKISDLQERKKELIGSILEPKKGFTGGLDEEDIRSLLDIRTIK